MPPNRMETVFNVDSSYGMNKVGNMPSAPTATSAGRYLFVITQTCLNLIGYILIGVIVGINMLFAFRNGSELNATNLHIVLCVLGYQLLMGVGILALTSESGFAVNMSLKHRRWLHTILQVIGSGLAIIGSIIKSLDKNVNFNTLHGKFALAALVFTTVCLINGIASLYAYEWRKYLPANLSKLSHILFGIVAFVMATVSLCYGFQKNSFVTWATQEFTTVLYVFTGIFTAICILNPFITFFSKLTNMYGNLSV